MKPIIELFRTKLNTKLEGEILTAVYNVDVHVNKERLLKALSDAKSFYDEGYADGVKNAVHTRDIPMKPVRIERSRYSDDYCPICGKQQKRLKRTIGKPWFCERCGQKLEWGDNS